MSLLKSQFYWTKFDDITAKIMLFLVVSQVRCQGEKSHPDKNNVWCVNGIRHYSTEGTIPKCQSIMLSACKFTL